jgi:membrane protease YdiL (CAAX protease family)
MEAKKISLTTFTMSTAAILFVETVFRLALVGTISSPLAALGFVRCLEAVLLIVIAIKFEKKIDAIGLARSRLITGLIKGLIWSAGFGFVAAVFYFGLLFWSINALGFLRSPPPSSWQHIGVFLLVGGILGPITEEIFFRGIIYGFFRRWGIAAAIILSTAIFVFSHPIGGNPPVTQLVGGIVFAVAYEKGKSLMVPITIHCLGNLAIFSLTYMS